MKCVKKRLIIILMILFSSSVMAEEKFNLSAGAWSEHVISNNISNEQHNLLAIQHKNVFLGYFKNSHDRDTFFISYYSEYRLLLNTEPFVALGVMHGYTKCYGDDNSSKNVCPMMSVGVSYTKYRIQPTIYFLGDAVAVGFRYQF